MAWTPSPPELIALFERLCPPSAHARRMFGYPCAFLNGNMFMGTFAERLWVRLDDDARATLLAIEGAGPFQPVAGRPMREYVVLPARWHATPDALVPWVGQALGYARSLPPTPHRKRSDD